MILFIYIYIYIEREREREREREAHECMRSENMARWVWCECELVIWDASQRELVF